MMIDSHEGPDHRIDQPKECPCCGAATAFEADVPDDDMAVSVGFACGAAVRWRSVFWASDSGSGCCESLDGVTECPSPGGRGTVQLFCSGESWPAPDIARVSGRLWWLGYRVQLVPSSGPPALLLGHYQVTGRRAISDFVGHLAANRGDIGFLAPGDFACDACSVSVEGRPGQLYQNCPKCGGLMSAVRRSKPAGDADIERRHRDGRDDLLRGVFG